MDEAMFYLISITMSLSAVFALTALYVLFRDARKKENHKDETPKNLGGE